MQEYLDAVNKEVIERNELNGASFPFSDGDGDGGSGGLGLGGKGSTSVA